MTAKWRSFLGIAVISLATMVMAYMVFPAAAWALNPQPLPPGMRHGTGSGGGAGKVIMTQPSSSVAQPGTSIKSNSNDFGGNSKNQGRD